MLSQLFFTKWLPLNHECLAFDFNFFFTPYSFPNNKVKFVGFSELGCRVGQYYWHVNRRPPSLLLLTASSIIGTVSEYDVEKTDI